VANANITTSWIFQTCGPKVKRYCLNLLEKWWSDDPPAPCFNCLWTRNLILL